MIKNENTLREIHPDNLSLNLFKDLFLFFDSITSVLTWNEQFNSDAKSIIWIWKSSSVARERTDVTRFNLNLFSSPGKNIGDP